MTLSGYLCTCQAPKLPAPRHIPPKMPIPRSEYDCLVLFVCDEKRLVRLIPLFEADCNLYNILSEQCLFLLVIGYLISNYGN